MQTRFSGGLISNMLPKGLTYRNSRCNANNATISIIGWATTLGTNIAYLDSRATGHPIRYLSIQVPRVFLVIVMGLTLPFIFVKNLIVILKSLLI